jgi:hypothetical protein
MNNKSIIELNHLEWIDPFSENCQVLLSESEWIKIVFWLDDLFDDYQNFAEKYHHDKKYKETIEIPKNIFNITILQLFIYYIGKNKIQKKRKIQYYLFSLFCLVASLYNDIDYLQTKDYLYQFLLYGNWLKKSYHDISHVFKIQTHIIHFFDHKFFNLPITINFLSNFNKFFYFLEEIELENFINNDIEKNIKLIFHYDLKKISSDPFTFTKFLISYNFTQKDLQNLPEVDLHPIILD